MKKTVSFILAIIFTMTLFTACSETNYNTPVIDETKEIYVSISAFWGTIAYEETDSEGNIGKLETASIDFIGHPGQKVEDILKNSGANNFEFYFDSDVLLGFITYRIDITTDEEGFENHKYIDISNGKYLSLEELMKQTPTENVAYVAKWQSVAERDYYDAFEADFDEETFSLSLYSNEGVIFFDDDIDGSTLAGFSIIKGKTLEFSMASKIKTIEKESFAFKGFTLYTAKDYEIIEEEATDLAENELCISIGDFGYLLLKDYKLYSENVSIEELEKIVAEEAHYFATANWA